MGEMRHADFLRLIFEANQKNAIKKPWAYASDLFHWCAARLLLGEDLGESRSWLESHLQSFRATGNPNRDLFTWAYLAATSELHDQPATAVASEAVSYIRSHPGLDMQDHQIVESALALSMLSGDEEEAARWFDLGLTLPPRPGAEAFIFEPLFMFRVEALNEEAALDILAGNVARVIYQNLIGPPYYSSAPSLCALAVLAKRRFERVAALIRGRLRELDQIIFGAGTTPRLTFKGPSFRPAQRGDEGTLVEIKLKVMGDGVLYPGAYPLEAITYDLPSTILGATAKTGRTRGDRGRGRQKLIEDALFKAEGTCRIALHLGTGVTISEQQEQFLRQRCRLAWEIATHKVKHLVCRYELEVKANGGAI
jgi:hypothetical protein